MVHSLLLSPMSAGYRPLAQASVVVVTRLGDEDEIVVPVVPGFVHAGVSGAMPRAELILVVDVTEKVKLSRSGQDLGAVALGKWKGSMQEEFVASGEERRDRFGRGVGR